MAIGALIAQSRQRDPEFYVTKLAGTPEEDAFQSSVGALPEDQQLAMWQAAMQARGADGAVNTKPIEEWSGAHWSDPRTWSTPQAKAAIAMKNLYAKNPQAVEAAGADWMQNKGGMQRMMQSWNPGQPAGGGWGEALTGKGMGTYLPLGAGLLGMVGGAATNNPMIAMLGLLAAGYGGYQMYNNYKTLKDPALWQQANAPINAKPPQAATAPGAPGSALDPAAQTKQIAAMGDFRNQQQTQQAAQQAARDKLSGAAATFPWLNKSPAPVAPAPAAAPAAVPAPAPSPAVSAVKPPLPHPGLAPVPAMPKQASLLKLAWGDMSEIPDRADLAASVKSHIDLYKMKQDIANDRLLDPVAAGKMLAGIEYAERRIDSAQASVGTFGLHAAPILGLAAGIALGSLYAMSPMNQAAVSQFGGGVVSGAQRLGVL